MKQLTARGERTRRKLLESAERIFAEVGYHDASIVKITEAAGVGQGTFYLYFPSKKEVFDEVVLDLNLRVRHAMTEASEKGTTRAERELLGFSAFFRFTAEHPALYRIIRQAEFVSPETLVTHYERLMRPYAAGLEQAMEAGEVARGDAEVLAWSLMGIGELVGMRWILWNGEQEMPEQVFDELAQIIVRMLGVEGELDRDRARRDGDLPPGDLDERRRDRGSERDPGAGDRGEVRAAREAHRGGGRARQRHVGRGGVAAARPARRSIRPRSTSSSTTARSGRTIRSGRRRPGSRTGSAASTPTRSSTRTSPAGRRSRSGSRATSCSRSPTSATS